MSNQKLVGELSRNNKSSTIPTNALSTRLTLLLAGFLFIAALGLRLYDLNKASFWLDETFQYFWSNFPIDRIIFEYGTNQAPLFYYLTQLQLLLLHWQDEAVLRSICVILGLGGVAACYFLGKELFNRKIGYTTAALAVFSPIMIAYSQDYRPYALFVLLSASSALFLISGLKTNSTRSWLAFCIFTIMNLYTHFNSVFTLAAEAAYIFLYLVIGIVIAYRKSRDLEAVLQDYRDKIMFPILSGFVIATAYIPGVAFLQALIKSGNMGLDKKESVPPVDLANFLDNFTRLGFGGGFVLWITLGLAALGFLYSLLNYRAIALFSALWLGLPLMVIAATSGGSMLLLSTRYIIFLVPVYLVNIAAGCVFLVELLLKLAGRLKAAQSPAGFSLNNFLLPVVLLGVFLISLPSLTSYYSNPKGWDHYSIDIDLRSAFDFVKTDLKSEDVVLGFVTSDPNSGGSEWTDYYYWYFLEKAPEGVVRVVPTYTGYSTNFFQPTVKDISTAPGRLWVVFIDGTDKEKDKIVSLADPKAKAGCYYKICAIQQPVAQKGSMKDQILTFANTYRAYNPALSKGIEKIFE